MDIGVSKKIAQSIVDTIKEFCGYDINFIDTDGFIFASTDMNRIGDYHEIGKRVADTGETLEVYKEDDYTGTQPGINAPFYYEGRVMAVIGITGDPDKVRQYSELAGRVTFLIFKENEYTSQSIGLQTTTNYMIRSLIYGEPINKNHFRDFMASRELPLNQNYRTAVIQTNSRYNPANLSFIERDIVDAINEIPMSMHRFQYPNEYVIIFEYTSCKTAYRTLQRLLEKYNEIITIAIGSEETLLHQNRSYEAAMLSLKCSSQTKNVAVYEDFDIELLLGSLDEEVSSRYIRKVASCLSEEDLNILKVYYDSNMSLKEASEKLFIHKNTLQYKLDKINTKSSYNPRDFRDANILYMALQLQKMIGGPCPPLSK